MSYATDGIFENYEEKQAAREKRAVEERAAQERAEAERRRIAANAESAALIHHGTAANFTAILQKIENEVSDIVIDLSRFSSLYKSLKRYIKILERRIAVVNQGPIQNNDDDNQQLLVFAPEQDNFEPVSQLATRLISQLGLIQLATSINNNARFERLIQHAREISSLLNAHFAAQPNSLPETNPLSIESKPPNTTLHSRYNFFKFDWAAGSFPEDILQGNLLDMLGTNDLANLRKTSVTMKRLTEAQIVNKLYIIINNKIINMQALRQHCHNAQLQLTVALVTEINNEMTRKHPNKTWSNDMLKAVILSTLGYAEAEEKQKSHCCVIC